MDDFAVSFDSDFLVALTEMISEKNDGIGMEFAELMKIAVEYHKLIDEYSENSIKVCKRMRDNGEMSEELFALMSNKDLTEEDFKKASKAVHDEYRKYFAKSNCGEIDRTELQETYKKAILLRKKLLKAKTNIIPAILDNYDLPEEMLLGIAFIVQDMEEQLNTMVLQAML